MTTNRDSLLLFVKEIYAIITTCQRMQQHSLVRHCQVLHFQATHPASRPTGPPQNYSPGFTTPPGSALQFMLLLLLLVVLWTFTDNSLATEKHDLAPATGTVRYTINACIMPALCCRRQKYFQFHATASLFSALTGHRWSALLAVEELSVLTPFIGCLHDPANVQLHYNMAANVQH